MGDSEAALLVSFYLSAATWGLTLVFSSLWGLVKSPPPPPRLPSSPPPIHLNKKTNMASETASPLRSTLGTQASVQ